MADRCSPFRRATGYCGRCQSVHTVLPVRYTTHDMLHLYFLCDDGHIEMHDRISGVNWRALGGGAGDVYLDRLRTYDSTGARIFP